MIPDSIHPAIAIPLAIALTIYYAYLGRKATR